MSEQKEPKVTGIGGVFFYSDNLDETKSGTLKTWGLSSMIGAPQASNPWNGNPLKRKVIIFLPRKRNSW